eukprot:755317-Hanusia_phi.AAC.2
MFPVCEVVKCRTSRFPHRLHLGVRHHVNLGGGDLVADQKSVAASCHEAPFTAASKDKQNVKDHPVTSLPVMRARHQKLHRDVGL